MEIKSIFSLKKSKEPDSHTPHPPLEMQALKRPVNRTFNNHIPQASLSDRQYLEESGKLCGIDLHLLNSPLCELKFFSILWFQFHSLSLCCCLKTKEQANRKQSSWRCLWELCYSFWVTPRASLETLWVSALET